jgi:hypothetical protein
MMMQKILLCCGMTMPVFVLGAAKPLAIAKATLEAALQARQARAAVSPSSAPAQVAVVAVVQGRVRASSLPEAQRTHVPPAEAAAAAVSVKRNEKKSERDSASMASRPSNNHVDDDRISSEQHEKAARALNLCSLRHNGHIERGPQAEQESLNRFAEDIKQMAAVLEKTSEHINGCVHATRLTYGPVRSALLELRRASNECDKAVRNKLKLIQQASLLSK